ncbi:DUF4279 domain-containing protein [Kitasatospora sp. NPDC049258]|uniref:DUF4279 domain-containing protein n=1 Tax=Kitasatospora sp. NPDC049258 TaxID=3155394 RepID=UPI00343A1EB1
MVKFTISSERISPEFISAALSLDPDRSSHVARVPEGSILGRPARINSWQLVEEGVAGEDVTDLLERIEVRVAGLREPIAELLRNGCSTLLSIVQYCSLLDEAGPGFVVKSSLLGFLSDVGAAIDVDQYVIDQ